MGKPELTESRFIGMREFWKGLPNISDIFALAMRTCERDKGLLLENSGIYQNELPRGKPRGI